MLGRPPGIPYDLLFEGIPGTRDAYPVRQIIFDDPEGGPQPVAIPDDMRDEPELLLLHLRERGLGRAKPVYAVAGENDIPRVTSLIEAAGGRLSEKWECPAAPSYPVRFTAHATVTSAYFRAAAKIAFHFTLKMFPDLTGLEPQFADIKDFIWSGGDIDRFVRQHLEPFVESFRRGYRPAQWMHILAVRRTPSRTVAYAQFFAGPSILPPCYEVLISKSGSRILTRPELRGHMFVIDDPGGSPGLVGQMVDGMPLNYILAPPPVTSIRGMGRSQARHRGRRGN